MKLSHDQKTLILGAFVGISLVTVAVYLKMILLPFFLGFLVAYILNSPVEKMASYGINRGIASAICIVSFLSLIVMILFFSVPFVVQQLRSLASKLPSLVESYANTLSPLIIELSERFGTPNISTIKSHLVEHLGDVVNWLVRIFVELFTSGMAVANIFSLIFITPIISLYLLIDWDKMRLTFVKLIPVRHGPLVTMFLKEVNDALSSYAKGQMIVCCILAVMYSVSLFFIGLHKPLLVGVMTGILSFIPYLGAVVGLITAIAISFLNYSGWMTFILIGVVFLGIGIIEGNVLTPKFVGNKIGLHPVWVLFALLAAGSTFGFVGIIFAFPLSAIIRIVIRHLVTWYRQTPYYLTLTNAD